MTFAEAQDWVIPFGKHKGKKLDDIAATDDGLLYLDWLRGQENLWPTTKAALDAYLDDPAIQKDLSFAHEADGVPEE